MPESKLHVETRGEGGRDVLLLHGFCETSAVWQPWAGLLSNCRVTAIDLPGFGASPLSDLEISIETVAREVLDLVRLHQWNPLVIGHSLGGYVALAMAELAPAAMDGLVLFHSTPFPDTKDRKANRDKAIAFVAEHGVAAFTKTLIPNLFFKKELPAVEWAKEIAAATPKTTVLAYLAAMRDRPDRSAIFGDFSGKKAILAGKNDGVVPIESLRKLAKRHPNSGLSELEDVGHMGMFEAPETTAQIVQGLISVT